jgi:hypothetical protein
LNLNFLSPNIPHWEEEEEEEEEEDEAALRLQCQIVQIGAEELQRFVSQGNLVIRHSR